MKRFEPYPCTEEEGNGYEDPKIRSEETAIDELHLLTIVRESSWTQSSQKRRKKKDVVEERNGRRIIVDTSFENYDQERTTSIHRQSRSSASLYEVGGRVQQNNDRFGHIIMHQMHITLYK